LNPLEERNIQIGELFLLDFRSGHIHPSFIPAFLHGLNRNLVQLHKLFILRFKPEKSSVVFKGDEKSQKKSPAKAIYKRIPIEYNIFEK
jgi:hypothetical protein